MRRDGGFHPPYTIGRVGRVGRSATRRLKDRPQIEG
jgi:hypothetical protein